MGSELRQMKTVLLLETFWKPKFIFPIILKNEFS